MALSRPFYASLLLQAIDGMMSLGLCSQLVSQAPLKHSQAPEHFRSTETQATCDGCCARQSICSVVSFEIHDPHIRVWTRLFKFHAELDRLVEKISQIVVISQTAFSLQPLA